MLPNFDPASLPAEQIPAAVAIIGGWLTQLAARQMRPVAVPVPQTDDADMMLTTEEAAELLRRSPRWIYRNAPKLPFVKRLSARSMVHSKKGIERYLASRKG